MMRFDTNEVISLIKTNFNFFYIFCEPRMKQMVHYVESLVIFKFERMKKMRKRTLVIMLLA